VCDNHTVAVASRGGCAFRPGFPVPPCWYGGFREVCLDLFTPGLFPGANINLDVGAILAW